LWWNPFAHVLLQKLRLVHEWEADEVAAQLKIKTYAETLVKYSSPMPFGMGISSYKQQLKQRIMKLQDQTSSLKTRLSVAAIPLLAAASLWFSPVVQAQEPEKVVLADVEVYPQPSGCSETTKEGSWKCFIEYVQKQIVTEFKYPAEAKEKRVQGRVFVQFVVGAEGSIKDVVVVRPSGSSNDDESLKPIYAQLDNEAVRVIQSIARMEPAQKNGKAVNMEMVFPINFKLSQE
jgi:protein TonB